MNSTIPTSLDVERLLKPISAEAAAGMSLRNSSLYSKVKEARRQDDDSLPVGDWKRQLKSADYPSVVTLCSEALETRSKDLQLAAWLVDAWALLHGIKGLTKGVELLTGLCSTYWEVLFPLKDDDGDESRLKILEWLDVALVRRLQSITLDIDQSTFGLSLEELASRENATSEHPSRTQESVLARMSMVDSSTWSQIHEDTLAALASVADFENFLIGVSTNSSGLRRLGGELRTLELSAEQQLGGSHLPLKSGAAQRESEGRNSTPSNVSEGPNLRPANSAEAIAGRAEAYRRLNEAADFLLRTEPHSPVPYLVKRAISWGNLPLAQLLEEFIGNADDLVEAHRLLGMRQRGE